MAVRSPKTATFFILLVARTWLAAAYGAEQAKPPATAPRCGPCRPNEASPLGREKQAQRTTHRHANGGRTAASGQIIHNSFRTRMAECLQG